MAEQQIMIAFAYFMGVMFWLLFASVFVLMMIAAFEYVAAQVDDGAEEHGQLQGNTYDSM